MIERTNPTSVMPVWLKDFFGDRIQVSSLLVVLCFVSVLALSSQSAASYPTYLLALSMLASLRRWNDVADEPFFWGVACLLLYLCATSFWSDPLEWRGVFGIFGRGLLVFFFVVAMAECQLRGQVQKWLGRALAVVGAAAALLALGVYFADPPPGGRLSGLGQLDNSVVVGLVFGAVLILLVEIILSDSDRRWQAAAIIGVLSTFTAIYLSGSRNAWVSTTFGLLVLLCAWRVIDRQRFVAALAAIVLILSVLAGALFLSDQGRELLLPRSDSFRLDIWSVVLSDVGENHFLFGKGILTPDSVSVGNMVLDHPHNMYLAIFFQGGVVGVALFLIFVAWTLRELFLGYEQRSAKLAMALLAMALTSYLLDGHELVDKVGETWFLFWLPVGIALGIAWNRRLQDH